MYFAGLLIVLIVGAILTSLCYPALYDVTPVQFRGRAIAVVMLLVSVVGIGGTVTAVALLTEHVFKDDAMVRASIAIVTMAAATLAPLLVVVQLRPYEALRLRGTAAQTSDFPVD